MTSITTTRVAARVPPKSTPKPRKRSTGAIKDADFSRTLVSRMKKQATRVNPESPLTHLPAAPPKRKGLATQDEAWQPRQRLENEATPPAQDLWLRSNYRTGDGDVNTPVRPGALDFLKWPSKGLKT